MSDPDALDGVRTPERQLDVRGFDKIRQAFTSQLGLNQLPGAILLHGPRGIGKATLAFDLARMILTTTGDEDAHRVQEQIAAGAHPNLHVLRRQPKDSKGFYTVIRVDDVRELRDRLRMTRGRTGYRVAIIDPIDDCNPSAANALLKTLEEPPPETIFLLISHRPGQLLPTIKSRCHAIAMRPISDNDVREVLLDQHGDDTQTIGTAVLLASGRPRRGFEALALGEQSALSALTRWLDAPTNFPVAVHLDIAVALAASFSTGEGLFAREILTNWIAAEAKNAAAQGFTARNRLASANALWEKANDLFTEADSLNLDPKQTLVSLFDAIRKHFGTRLPANSLQNTEPS